MAERAEARTKEDPKDANAWYCMAYALGRYSQGISIAKALARAWARKVKNALETTIKLSPKHADAHTALGAFHAEIIDKVGSLLGRTQGASKDAGLGRYKTALKLNPGSAIAMVEYANGLVMLEGDKRMKEATKLYEDAAKVRAAWMRWSGSTWRWRRRSWRTERRRSGGASAGCRCGRSGPGPD